MTNDVFKSGATVECKVCDKIFDKRGTKEANESSLRYHMETHKERSLSCPGCHRLYRHVSAVSMHFESGSCAGCRGKFKARQKMYDFARNSHHMRQYLADPPSIQYVGNIPDIAPVPKFPYKCRDCVKKFHQQSQMYQHMFAKHTEEIKVEVEEEKPAVKTFRAVLVKKKPDVQLDRFTQSNIEIMQRRSKKFGTISSPVVGMVSESEVKERRRQRFGVASVEDLEKFKKEKFQKRKERFTDEIIVRRKERFGDQEMPIKMRRFAQPISYMDLNNFE